MNKYIKTDTIKDFFKDNFPQYVYTDMHGKGMLEAILEQPSIDIVRCEECKHGTYLEDAEMYICNAIGQEAFDAGHFCSYGERSEK